MIPGVYQDSQNTNIIIISYDIISMFCYRGHRQWTGGNRAYHKQPQSSDFRQLSPTK